MTKVIGGFRDNGNAAENKVVLAAGHCKKREYLNAKIVINKLKMTTNNALSEVASRHLRQGSKTPDTYSETGA